MQTAAHILSLIDPQAPFRMVVEASVRDYCVLALQFLKGEASPQNFFDAPLPQWLPVVQKELEQRQFAAQRYCKQLYAPSEEALLADAIADLAFAQSTRLSICTPANPQADDRERACVFIVAVYTLFALALHDRTDFAVLFLEAWDNFNAFASARTVRRHYDGSWASRYSPHVTFYPLG